MVHCHFMNSGWVNAGYHEMVGILKPYHMLKNLFELIALKGNGDRKTLVKLSLPNILLIHVCLFSRSH